MDYDTAAIAVQKALMEDTGRVKSVAHWKKVATDALGIAKLFQARWDAVLEAGTRLSLFRVDADSYSYPVLKIIVFPLRGLSSDRSRELSFDRSKATEKTGRQWETTDETSPAIGDRLEGTPSSRGLSSDTRSGTTRSGTTAQPSSRGLSSDRSEATDETGPAIGDLLEEALPPTTAQAPTSASARAPPSTLPDNWTPPVHLDCGHIDWDGSEDGCEGCANDRPPNYRALRGTFIRPVPKSQRRGPHRTPVGFPGLCTDADGLYIGGHFNDCRRTSSVRCEGHA